MYFRSFFSEKLLLLNTDDDMQKTDCQKVEKNCNSNSQESQTNEEKADESQFRKQLVDLMLDATMIWDKATSSNTIELAEKSKIWKIEIAMAM